MKALSLCVFQSVHLYVPPQICATFNGIPIKKTALIIREKTKKPKDPRISAEIFWLIIIHKS